MGAEYTQFGCPGIGVGSCQRGCASHPYPASLWKKQPEQDEDTGDSPVCQHLGGITLAALAKLFLHDGFFAMEKAGQETGREKKQEQQQGGLPTANSKEDHPKQGSSKGAIAVQCSRPVCQGSDKDCQDNTRCQLTIW